jgi:uncharacterized protein DUF5681
MSRNRQSKPYKIGYGRPPIQTRFKKGQSGNPSGRPRGNVAKRIRALALKEAYRLVRIKEGDKTLALPAIQAVVRAQIALAAKGNGPAQRALIAAVEAFEEDAATEAAIKSTAIEPEPRSELDVVRRIAFSLERAGRELARRKKAKEQEG